MKTRRIKVMKLIIEDKTANQINFGCSRKDGGTGITEIDLEFANISLRLANVQKKFKKNVTAISCPLKPLDRFT